MISSRSPPATTRASTRLWFAEALAAVDRLPVRLFQPYGVTPELAYALKRRMSQWAREIRSANDPDDN